MYLRSVNYTSYFEHVRNFGQYLHLLFLVNGDIVLLLALVKYEL